MSLMSRKVSVATTILIGASLSVFLLSGCGKSDVSVSQTQENKEVTAVVT